MLRETGWIALGIVAWSMKKAAPKSRQLDRQRSDARRLQATYLIRKAQGAGFTLEEIKELIDLDSGHDRHRANEIAQKRLTKLDEQIAELQRARASVERLAIDCAQGTEGACPILVAFDI